MTAKKTTDIARVVRLLDAQDAQERTLFALYIDDSGMPRASKLTRIAHRRTRGGTVHAAVTDWTVIGHGDGTDPAHYVGQAGGFGHDKLAAATARATVAGVTVGDHGERDAAGKRLFTLDEVCDRLVYEREGCAVVEAARANARRHLGLPDDTPVTFLYA